MTTEDRLTQLLATMERAEKIRRSHLCWLLWGMGAMLLSYALLIALMVITR